MLRELELTLVSVYCLGLPQWSTNTSLIITYMLLLKNILFLKFHMFYSFQSVNYW